MAGTIGKRKDMNHQEVMGGLSSLKTNEALTLQLLKIRKELVGLLQLLNGL